MSRYLTRRYVAVTWIDALRLALIDHTSIEEIHSSLEVELLHRTDWWAWWSDERLTTAIGLPDDLHPQGLSPDAVELIDEMFFSEAHQPQCGWSVLAQVKQILNVEPLSVSLASQIDKPEHLEELTVEFTSGKVWRLYRFWAGDEDGYRCDIRTHL